MKSNLEILVESRDKLCSQISSCRETFRAHDLIDALKKLDSMIEKVITNPDKGETK